MFMTSFSQQKAQIKSHLYCLSLIVSPMAANLVKDSMLLLLPTFSFSFLLHDCRGVWLTFTNESFPVLDSDHLDGICIKLQLQSSKNCTHL